MRNLAHPNSLSTSVSTIQPSCSILRRRTVALLHIAMTTTIKRKAPETTSATPKAKQCRPGLGLPNVSEIPDLVQQNMTDPEQMQHHLYYGYSFVDAVRESMVSSTVCAICHTEGSMKSRKKCKSWIFTICEDCECEEEFEDTGVIKCFFLCEDVLCKAEKEQCKRQTCKVCNKEF